MGSLVNIGSVVYSLTQNEINPKWAFSKNNEVTIGTGIGKRKSRNNNGFEGEYEIIYTTASGFQYPMLNLKIIKNEGYFKLDWVNGEGKINYEGVGIEEDNKLSAGWFNSLAKEYEIGNNSLCKEVNGASF